MTTLRPVIIEPRFVEAALANIPLRERDDDLIRAAARAYVSDARSYLRLDLGNVLGLPGITGDGSVDDGLIVAAVQRLVKMTTAGKATEE